MKPETIIFRLQQAKDVLEPWKEKAQKLRDTVAGDRSHISADGISQKKEAQAPEELRACWITKQQPRKLLRREFAEAQANLIAQQLRVMVAQVGWRQPDFDFPGLDPYEGMLMEAYLKQMLGRPPHGCGAASVKNIQLQDRLVTGCSAAGHWIRNGRPVIETADPLMCLWDWELPLFQMHRWRACSRQFTLKNAVERWGKAKFEHHFDQKGDDKGGDPAYKRIELIYYWSVEDEDGQFAVIDPLMIDKDESKAMIELGASPAFYMDNGYPQPFLPLQLEPYMEQPGVLGPVGLVDMMLPHQISADRLTNAIMKKVHASIRLIVARDGAVDAATLRAVVNGEKDFVTVDEEAARQGLDQVFKVIEGGGMDGTAFSILQNQIQQLVSMGGVNPYASGQISGVEFATEAKQIQARGDLHANALAEQYAESWADTARMILALGQNYDESATRLEVMGVIAEFNMSEQDLLANFLRPDARIEVRPDTVQFEGRERRLSRQRALAADAAAMGRPEAQILVDKMLLEEGVPLMQQATGQMQ